MSGNQRHHLLPLALVSSLGLVVLCAPAVQAHTHPTPIERAAPAVVFIEARAHVEVALIEHHTGPEKRAVHISIVQSTWNPLVDTASGFFVDPNGTVVTTGQLLTPRVTEAEVFAVNQAFARRYGAQAPLPRNPGLRHHVGSASSRVDQRLQACYPPHTIPNDAGGCVIRTTMAYTVHPYVTDQRLYGNLPAEVDSEHSTTEVALLRVRSNNLPTVTVAPPSPQETALAVLGFTDIPGPTGDHREQVINQHFANAGGPVLKSANLDAAEAAGSAMLRKELGHGLEGGPVVAGGGKATSSGQVVGLIPAAAPAGQPVPRLVGAATILNVLRSAGVENRPSLTDAQFEAAMHHFKNKEYAASIQPLKDTLKEFPGHALAAADLATAKAAVAKGLGTPTMTPATATSPAPSRSASSTGLLLGGLVVAAVAVLVAVGLARRQRRGGHEAGKVPGEPGRPSDSAARAGGQQRGGPAADQPVPVRDQASAGMSPARGAAAAGASSRLRERPEVAHPAPARASAQPSAVQRAAKNRAASGQQLTAGARSGGPVPAPPAARFCTSCGEGLAAGHRFCGRCGAPAGY